MVGIFAKFPGNRSTRRSKHFLEERVGNKRISPAAGAHGVPPLETFVAVEHPSEPSDVDQPARCPPPEPSIMQDGRIWKERIAETLRRRSEMKCASRDGIGGAVGRVGSTPARRSHSRSFDKSLFETHSAPERIVRRLIE